MDTLERLIKTCGKYFTRFDRHVDYYVAAGVFKLGKLDTNGNYRGTSQEVRYFEGKTPLIAMQKLYYELKKHYENEFKPNETDIKVQE